MKISESFEAINKIIDEHGDKFNNSEYRGEYNELKEKFDKIKERVEPIANNYQDRRMLEDKMDSFSTEVYDKLSVDIKDLPLERLREHSEGLNKLNTNFKEAYNSLGNYALFSKEEKKNM